MDQAKLERMLLLMKELSDNEQKTVSDLARGLHTTTRSIYRYIDTFRSAGFSVMKRYPQVYCLTTLGTKFVDFSRLVMFSQEEAFIVSNLISSLDNSNTLKKGLARKLSAVCGSVSLAEFVANRATARQVGQLQKAIEEKRQAVLRSYESGHSHSVRDRLVEPFRFTVNLTDILAFEPESGEVKTFRISRMGSVEVLDTPWQNESLHAVEEHDVFRMSGDREIPVRIELSLYAKNLLVEEFPVASRDLRRTSTGKWILDTKVRSLAGVGRFVVGLAGEVRIVKSPELAEYVGEFARKVSLLASSAR